MENTKNKFDFEAFPKQASEVLKSSKPMVGREGIFTTLLKIWPLHQMPNSMRYMPKKT